MINLLFVDDEPKVLDGLRRMLHGMRQEWGMRFVSGGREALAALAAAPADVVISDMRMPEISGAMLFAEIETLYPRTARILLTGQSNYESTLRLAGPSQVFISKPCDGAQLTRIVARAVELRRYLWRQPLQNLMDGLRWDKSLLPTYFKIRDELLQEKPSVTKIVSLIESDPEFERAFLHLADIVYLQGHHVVSPHQAIRHLKPENFRTTIVAATILSLIRNDEATQSQTDGLTREALRVALLSARICRLHGFGAEVWPLSFLAGLLHNTGAAVLASNTPDKMHQFAEQRKAAPESMRVDAERRIWGASFGEITGYLLAEWGLPDAMVEAVTYQEEPGLCGDPQSPVLAAVHIAKWLAGWLAAGKKIDDLTIEADGKVQLDRTFLGRQNFHLQPEAYREFMHAVSGG